MGTSRSIARDPNVDRDLGAANVCDKKTWMERLELVEQATCTAVADGCQVFLWHESGIGASSTSGVVRGCVLTLCMLRPLVDYL